MGRSFPPLPCPSCETGTMRLARGRVSTLARRNVTVHLRDFEAPRCDNSRCDEVFTQEVDEKAIHAAANAVLAEETWRALLARDVAEVERHAAACLRAWVASFDPGSLHPHEDAKKLIARAAAGDIARECVDCQAWLTRARAALT